MKFGDAFLRFRSTLCAALQVNAAAKKTLSLFRDYVDDIAAAVYMCVCVCTCGKKLSCTSRPRVCFFFRERATGGEK